MGNRGVLLGRTGTFQPFTSEKRWIICQLEFKGRRRPLMQPGLYTELFFLDEATALAAGHRPCFECRREAAKKFRDLAECKTFPELDAQLHKERTSPHPLVEDWHSLPDGTMIAQLDQAFLVCRGNLYKWSHSGYEAAELFPALSQEIILLTPLTTIKILSKGYKPQIDA